MSYYGPPHLRRRTLLKLGIATAVALGIVGGAVALLQPGLQQGKLSEDSRLIFSRVGQAVLLGTLPIEAGPNQIAINSLLSRIDNFVQNTPEHVQAELSELLSLLATSAGRMGIVGLTTGWASASTAEIALALQSMRSSSLALRIQVYQALHDIVSASYFSGLESWPFLGYPGPRAV